MAGDDRFLASGHYGSDSTIERLNEGWSPGGKYLESYIDGTMDAESTSSFEALMVEKKNIQDSKAIQKSEPMKRLEGLFEKRRQERGWHCSAQRKKATYQPIGPSDPSELDRFLSTALSTDSLNKSGLPETHVSSLHPEMGDSVDPANHTFSEDLKNVVSVIKDSDRFEPEIARIVEDMRTICQDDEALSAMCIYISVCSKSDHAPPEMREAIARQPWGKRGEDAMKTYHKFLASTPTLLSPVVAVELTEKLMTELENHVMKSGLEIMGPKTNLFDKMPNSPHRRPSVRSGDRSQESQQSEGQLKRARHEQTSPRRALTPPAKPGFRSAPDAKRPRSAESKQEFGDSDEDDSDFDEVDETTIQQHLMPPGNLPSKQSSGPSKKRIQKKKIGRPQTRPHLSVFAEAAAGDSLKKALNEKDKLTIKPEDANGKEAKSTKSRLKARLKAARDASAVKTTSSTVFEKVKNHLAELFLPGTDLETCGTLKEQLDYTVELYKMLQQPWSPCHIRKNPNVRCESDTEEDTGTCLGGRDKDWPKCFLEMLTENAIFLGKCSVSNMKVKRINDVLWDGFLKAFEQPENFLLCFSRAITKLLDKYCIDNNIKEPVFYPNHIEIALIMQARKVSGKKNQRRELEAETWSTVLGIDKERVKHKLAIYRAKEVTHVDYKLDSVVINATKGGPHRARMRGSVAVAMRGGLATSNRGDENQNQPTEFLGQRGYFEIPEEIQAMMRRWLIDNSKNLTGQNRFQVDAQTLQDWRQLLKTKYPDYTSSLTDGVASPFLVESLDTPYCQQKV